MIAALAISVVLNIILKKFGISQIIGYVATGTIVAYGFDLHYLADSHALEQVAEFGIVFLMFTIGLEISLERLATMKRTVFGNGSMQVGITAVAVYLLMHYLFGIEFKSSLIIALAFSLSSTAIVLTHLKASKEIHMPYGQRSMGILIFQDIAVIPILLLIGFLSGSEGDFSMILLETFFSAVLVIGLLFVVGKRLMTWLLHFAAESNEEELFLASVLLIAVGASMLAHLLGFTYSLGAFVAGMIIAETKYHHKVEADIASFKDLLLGLFFVTVGLKIDIAFLLGHIGLIVSLLFGIMLLKSIIIFGVIRLGSENAVAMKTALALSQVGEFSFAIFALAGSAGLLDASLEKIIVLMVVLSMVLTPFIISRVNVFVLKIFRQPSLQNDYSGLGQRKNHIIVCGYSIVGKIVSKKLREQDSDFIVIDNSLKHVYEGLANNEDIYFGDFSKPSISEALNIEDAAAVIITLDNAEKKRLICEAVLKYSPQANLVVKVVSLEEKEMLSDLPISVMIDGKREVARILVDAAMKCDMKTIG